MSRLNAHRTPIKRGNDSPLRATMYNPALLLQVKGKAISPSRASAARSRSAREYRLLPTATWRPTTPRQAPPDTPVAPRPASSCLEKDLCFATHTSLRRAEHLQRQHSPLTADQLRQQAVFLQKYSAHTESLRSIYTRPQTSSCSRRNEEAQFVSQRQQQRTARRAKSAQLLSHLQVEERSRNAYLTCIGPHVDIWQHFHGAKRSQDHMVRKMAIVVIQRWVRGWLVRRRMERLHRKCIFHAASFTLFMQSYFGLLRRIQKRNAIRCIETPFNARNVESFMDAKLRYEVLFAKRADHDGLVREADFEAFLHDCDLWPTQNEVLQSRKVVFADRYFVERKFAGYSKSDAIEIIFNIFPPPDTGIKVKRQSSWLYPIVMDHEAARILAEQQVNPPPPPPLHTYKTDSRIASNLRDVRSRSALEKADGGYDENIGETTPLSRCLRMVLERRLDDAKGGGAPVHAVEKQLWFDELHRMERQEVQEARATRKRYEKQIRQERLLNQQVSRGRLLGTGSSAVSTKKGSFAVDADAESGADSQ